MLSKNNMSMDQKTKERKEKRILLNAKHKQLSKKVKKEKVRKEKGILRGSKYKHHLESDLYLPSKPKEIIEIKEEEAEKVICCVCFKENQDMMFINCKQGGLFTKNYKKWRNSNTPICVSCVKAIKTSSIKCCPLCRSEDWTRVLSVRYPKKKPCFAAREAARQRKNALIFKLIKQRLRRYKIWHRMMCHGHDPGACPYFDPYPDNRYSQPHCLHCGYGRSWHANDPFVARGWDGTKYNFDIPELT